jgi:Mrp family chromosome partitioning ATPase
MSKIYEALQLAGRSRDEDSPRTVLAEQAEPAVAPEPGLAIQRLVQASEPAPFPLHLEHTMTALYNSISSLLPTTKGRTIEFMAPHKGAGTSTLVREFAKVVAVKLKKSVLLLDADHHAPTQTREFQIKQVLGWDSVLDRSERIESVLNAVGDSRLTVSQLLMNESAQPLLFESNQFRGMLTRLKETFDLILIDAPPATEYADGFVLGSKVDGIVLVAAAEETRWQAMQDVTRRAQLMGCNVLGMILNNQRYHIPQAIYDRI